MKKVKVKCRVKTDTDSLFETIKDFKRYKDFVPSVKKVKVLEKDKNRAVSQWDVDYEGAPFRWTEEAVFFEQSKKVMFKAIDGDFYYYCGEWNVEKADETSSYVKLEAFFNWGVPNLEKYIGDTLEEKAEKALKGLVYSIKRRCE